MKRHSIGPVLGTIGVFVFLIVGFVSCNIHLGIGAWGPAKTWDITVERTYVDYSGSGDERQSHYMVGTDKGVFECDNSFAMGIWNADELYSKLIPGKKFRIRTKGNRVVGMFFQEYPYVTAVSPLD